ncbi:N-acetyl sugar amidotransferase, partial [Alphaproteobacteria bacterium]|nr:N-acetyl sugar amidotransferase [Alphaproteobacteria bacterium]
AVEFKQKAGDKKQTIAFDDEGICDACKYAKKKKSIDWMQREKELTDLCDRHRRSDGKYDVIIPGSGGKDSIKAAHLLRYKYRMNPILVTWPPGLYTEIGKQNFDAWLNAGFANYTYNQNRKLHRFLTKAAFENLGHPFQPFILGQKNLAPRLSVLFDIPLVVYGENEAEYGNAIEDNDIPTRHGRFFTSDEALSNLNLGGIQARELIEKHGFSLSDLEAYFPIRSDQVLKTETEIHYLGYYVRWHPQETYYYSVENTEFMPNSERTEGSYSKYNSLDDKIDWLHYHTTYVKFGIGRATYDSAQEIRNGDITRDEGISLVRRFDGEFPKVYIEDCCKYMGITLDRYHEVIEQIRSPHLWEKINGKWELRTPIYKKDQ